MNATTPVKMSKKQAIVFLLLIFSNSIFSQPPNGVHGKQSKRTGIARGTLNADLDCSVKLNGSLKPIQLKSNTPLIVTLRSGDNSIEASSDDKKSNLKFSVTGLPGDTIPVEISFFDDSKFLEYITQGNMQMVETAVKKNPALISNKNGTLPTSPLEAAIVNSQPEVVSFLLSKGASFTSPKNIYPLHKAITFASSATITRNKKRTPATDSILVELFLSKGCDINEKNEAGNTPLHCAILAGKSDIVTLLVEKGADINIKNTFDDTPLKLAENKGQITMIDYLKTKGAYEK